ncbi:MAG: DUF4199 domain-containing protein [Cyclobacteriaceae bacterium]|nr:DUF4199 domain-containing protein [Cyclobacteriaceae bacterium]
MEESAAPSVTTRSAGTRYGVIMAVISIVMFVGMTVAGMDMTSGIGRWLGIPVFLIVLYLAQKYFLDNGDGFMSYGQGIGITFWFSLISTVIYIVFFYIYIKFIDGSFVETIKQQQMDEMAQRGMSDEQIEQSMNIAGAFMTPEMMAAFGFLGAMFFDMLCGVVLTIFTQKNNPQPAI